MTQRFAIVGGGQAASSAAVKLRELNADCEIEVFSAESVLPYQRPPLSKKYLSGEMPIDRLILRPQNWFDEQRVKIRCNSLVETIDRSSKTLTMADGRVATYDRLLIATGSTPRKLPASFGGGLKGVHTLRSTQDADDMRPLLKSGSKLVVIGGGYIGLEVAAVAAQLGLSVTLVEMAPRILQRVASEQTSDFYRDLHSRHGVEILENAALDLLNEENGSVVSAQLKDGSIIEADHVLVGIGVSPEIVLAEACELSVENGIAVDEFCRTSDPNIFSAGDCTSFPHNGNLVRLESVPHAIHQAEIAAANMLGGDEVYRATPWFWSDQYDVKLQIAGLNSGYDQTVVRPGKREGAQSIWYYRENKLLAVDAMNDAPAFMMARKIIEAGKSVPPDVVANSETNLKDWV